MKTLTFIQYVGGGHAHYFKHNKTGEIVCISSNEKEYYKMGEEGGSVYNPTLDGYTWLYSANGSIRVDTPSQLLKDGEYTTINDKHIAGMNVSEGGIGMQYKWLPLEAINDKHEIDETLWL